MVKYQMDICSTIGTNINVKLETKKLRLTYKPQTKRSAAEVRFGAVLTEASGSYRSHYAYGFSIRSVGGLLSHVGMGMRI